MISPTQRKGSVAENIALNYLLQQGLKSITQNYRQKCGEIDLIMLDKQVLVFIEVRYRGKNSYCDSLESIDYHKTRRIIRTAEIFLLNYREYQNHPARFDVLALAGTANPDRIEWIKDAFRV